VVVEERQQVADGVVERDIRRARPDRSDQRDHEMRDEVAGKPCGPEEFAEGSAVCHVARQFGAGEPVEARHLGEQAQIAR